MPGFSAVQLNGYYAWLQRRIKSRKVTGQLVAGY